MPPSPDFDSIKQQNILGYDYWSARDLMPLLGYVYWQSFEQVVQKAMLAATSLDLGMKAEDHFSLVAKMVTIGFGKSVSR